MLNNKFLISGVLLLSLGCGTARRFDIAEKKVLTPSPEQQSQGGLLGQNGLGQNGLGQGALDVSTITGNKDPKSLTGLDQLEGDLNSKVAKLDPKNLKGNLEADLKGKINTDIPDPKAELDSKLGSLTSVPSLDTDSLTGGSLSGGSISGLDQMKGELDSKVAKLDPKNLKGNLEADLKGKINTDIPDPKAELDSKLGSLTSVPSLDTDSLTGGSLSGGSISGLDQMKGELDSKVAKLDPKNLKGNLEADLKGKINTDIPNPKAELDSKMNALESFGFGEEAEEIAKVDGIGKDVQNLGNISADQVGESLKDNALDSVNSKTTKIVNGIEYNIADSEETADTVSPGATVRPKATVRSATQGKFYVQVSADTESSVAEQRASSYQQAGMKVEVKSAFVNGTKYYRVLVGPYGTEHEAAKQIDSVVAVGANNGDPFVRLVK